MLAGVLAERLAAAGAGVNPRVGAGPCVRVGADVGASLGAGAGPGGRGGAVVLAAAGSADPAGAEDAQRMAEWLAAEIGTPITVGYASAARPTVAEAVRAARAAGAAHVTVASYLLAPGHFADQLRASGADLVTPPLSPHPVLAELVLQRYDAVCAAPLLERE
jgi:sirohydrochlorin ferrochelatase